MDSTEQRYPQKGKDIMELLKKWDRTVEPFRKVKWVQDSEDGKQLVLTGR
jgi:hypothetical protein